MDERIEMWWTFTLPSHKKMKSCHFDSIMLSEICQMEKDNYRVILTHIWSLKKTNKIKSIYTETRLLVTTVLLEGFPDSSDGKESACNTGDPGSIPGSGRSSGEDMATHSSILACKIPWTEKPGGLQAMGLQQMGCHWATNTFTFTY